MRRCRCRTPKPRGCPRSTARTATSVGCPRLRFDSALAARPRCDSRVARDRRDEIAGEPADARAAPGRRSAHGGLAYWTADARPLAQVVRDGAWLTRPDRVGPWLELRQQVSVRSEIAGPNRVLVAVTNRGDAAGSDLALRVHLNSAVQRVEVQRTTLQQASPQAIPDLEASRVDLRLPEVSPRSSHAYHIDLY